MTYQSKTFQRFDEYVTWDIICPADVCEVVVLMKVKGKKQEPRRVQFDVVCQRQSHAGVIVYVSDCGNLKESLGHLPMRRVFHYDECFSVVQLNYCVESETQPDFLIQLILRDANKTVRASRCYAIEKGE